MQNEIWYPEESGTYPLILFSHFSGGDRLASSFICRHLAEHGYIVAATDHTERTQPRPSEAKTLEERDQRMSALIGSRVPDMRRLLNDVFAISDRNANPDAKRIGVMGHSFGGWTALQMAEEEPRVRAVVAMAPAGASNPRPGIIPATLRFGWKQRVDTLVVAGDADVSTPLEGIRELFGRIPEPKRLVILHAVDHLHFVDDARERHEAVRVMNFPPELHWIQEEMLPFDQLADQAKTHEELGRLALEHFDHAFGSS